MNMRSVLIPVDGSKSAEMAVRSVAQRARSAEVGSIHLLNVQPPVSGYAGRFVCGEDIRDFHREEAAAAMSGARRILDAANLAYSVHVCSGDVAPTIAQAADEIGAHEIVMAGEGEGLLSDLMARLHLSRVLKVARVPVTVIKSVQTASRFGLRGDRLQPS
jgi:nucleotide-binding universal stress UspA family protein